MATATFGQTCRIVSSSRSKPAARVTACKASSAEHAQRRRTLLIGATVPLALAAAQRTEALEKFDLPIDQLATFDRIEQRGELETRAREELKKVLGPQDARKALRLVLNDAGTYDAGTKNGGVDASIILNKSEAGRPENAGLSDYVAKLATAKAAVDAGNKKLGSEPISWSDIMCLAVKVTTQAEWRQIKVARAAIPSGGEQIVQTFGSAWDFKLGRLDSAEDPNKKTLNPSAGTEEMRQFYLDLGVKPGSKSGFLTAKPPFWEKYSFILYCSAQDDPKAAEERLAAESEVYAAFKLDYDRSRYTVTRTNYEVDFINSFTKLATLGAKFNPDCYLHTRPGFKLA